MAKVTGYTFTSADDVHTTIQAIKWEPEEKDPVAVLQIVHGMQEYADRYSEFAEYLAQKGFVVFGHDHIGHGGSVSGPEDLGRMHCKRPDAVMVEDIYSNYKIIRQQYPDKPYFILGHSMGSYLLREYLSVRSADLSKVNGAVIMGTGSEKDAALIGGRILCKLIMAFKGADAGSDFINRLMFGKDYEGEDISDSWLSHNADNVREFLDPSNTKRGGEFSLNGYMVLLRATWFDNRMSNIRKMNMDIPVLFTSGDQDPVGNFGEGVRKAYDKFKEAGVKDLSIKLYEGDRHEILNELDRQNVYDDLYEWMSNRLVK